MPANVPKDADPTSTQVAKRSRRNDASGINLVSLEGQSLPLALGNKVKAVYKHDQPGLKKRCRGVVQKIHSDNTFDIEYEPNFDGIVEVEVKKPRRFIQKMSEK